MKSLLSICIVAICLCFALDNACAQSGSPAPTPTRESAATLVVYNNLDPDSIALAAYYAKHRAIPIDHIVGLNCPTSEEITRQQYDDTIANPLRKSFAEHGFWHVPEQQGIPVSDNQIRFVVLMRGVPLKIAEAANYLGDKSGAKIPQLGVNAASVDSEVAMLGFRTHQITGPARNPYFQRYTPFMDLPASAFMLVCRLDGPTVEDVQSMIDGALAAERHGLNGFAYFDLRGITSGPMAEGDQWLATGAVEMRHTMPVIWSNSLYPDDFPMDHAAIYLGWYALNVTGPMTRPDFHFVPGAIAVHIHSFSAMTVRNPQTNWVGPLIARGAAATVGNVYEPYLDLTTHLDILVDRLANGFNFAEAAYAATPVTSWMTTFVGDPLYRPFPVVDASLSDMQSQPRPASEYAAYKEGAQTWFGKGRAAGEAQLQTSAKKLHSGIIWEGLGLLEWSIPSNDAALADFRNAQQCYGASEDGLRTILHQTEILKAEGKPDVARALAAKSLPQYKFYHGAELLRGLIGLPSPSGSPPP
jgi:uncharacterized protein (TIGR03790 family)